MGVLKRFEQRLEGLVNGTFAKVFKSEVQPVEIAGALQRECDNNATIWNRERTVVPNDFVVELSTSDFDRLSPYADQLGDELGGMVREYARQQRYTFMGSVKVHLEKADDLDTGLYRVRSRTLASSSSQQRGGGDRPSGGDRPESARNANGSEPSGRGGQDRQGTAGPGGQAGQPPMPPGAPAMPSAAPPTPAHPPGGGGPAAGRPMPRSETRRWIEINGNRHQMSRSTLVLGRSTEADVRVDDPGVSRRHCEVRVQGDGTGGNTASVQDLGSTNGIVVDGQHTSRATLRDGSRIVVGSTTIIYRQAEG